MSYVAVNRGSDVFLPLRLSCEILGRRAALHRGGG